MNVFFFCVSERRGGGSAPRLVSSSIVCCQVKVKKIINLGELNIKIKHNKNTYILNKYSY